MFSQFWAVGQTPWLTPCSSGTLKTPFSPSLYTRPAVMGPKPLASHLPMLRLPREPAARGQESDCLNSDPQLPFLGTPLADSASCQATFPSDFSARDPGRLPPMALALKSHLGLFPAAGFCSGDPVPPACSLNLGQSHCVLETASQLF